MSDTTTNATDVMKRETAREMCENEFGYYKAAFPGSEQETAAYKAVAFQWYCAGRRSVVDQCWRVIKGALDQFGEMRERVRLGGE